MDSILVVLKHETLQRNLVGRIIGEFEAKGARIIGLKLCQPTASAMEQLYQDHAGRPYFRTLIQGMMRGPVIAMVVGCIASHESYAPFKDLQGSHTVVGTIRGRFSIHESAPLLHVSDTPESASREIALFFSEGEILDYQKSVDEWLQFQPDGQYPD